MKQKKTVGPICLRIASVIEQLGLRQDEFAYLINTAKSTVSSWLSGARNPSRRNLERVVYATDVNPDWLFAGEGERWLGRAAPTKNDLFEIREGLEIEAVAPDAWMLGLVGRDGTRLRSKIRKPRSSPMFGKTNYLSDEHTLIAILKERLADRDRQLADKDQLIERLDRQIKIMEEVTGVRRRGED